MKACMLYLVLLGSLCAGTMSMSTDKLLNDLEEQALLERILQKLEPEEKALSAGVLKEGAVEAPVEEKVPVSDPRPCCDRGETFVDLTTAQIWSNKNPAVQVTSRPTRTDEQCTAQAVFKVQFEQPCWTYDVCLHYPLCGRRMLRIDLYLSASGRSGWMFNVGDSVSNDGYGGDSNHQTHDAETYALYPNIAVKGSDECPPDDLATLNNAVDTAVNTVTLFVSDGHIRIKNDNGLDQVVCKECLYALRGQADLGSNGPNEDIYVGLNRVIRSTSRVGTGVCSARFSWVCPNCY